MNSLFKSFDNIWRLSIRYKHDFTLKENLAEIFENGTKYRNQPGTRRLFAANLPFKLQFAATSVINSNWI